MTRTKNTRRKGPQNFQSSSRAIEKRLIQRHMQRIHAASTVFGLPSARMDVLEKIKPHTRLFLYDFDMKLLYGVYVAASDGKLAIEPAAFGGRFSAQVRFEILRDCIPLPESIFKPAIVDNYKGSSKFSQELSNKQVANLISLFRPVAEPSPGISGSLMPNTVRSATIIPRSSEIRAQTASELSHEYNQYLARLNHTNEGAASTIRHVEPGLSLAHAPHSLLANRDLPPDFVSASQFGPFNSAEGSQTHLHANPVLRHRSAGMPYDSERLMLQQLEPRNNCYKQGKTAAYWVQMASENAKGVDSSSPGRIGIGSKSIGASDAVVGQACSAVQEINDRGTVQPAITVHGNDPNVLAGTNADAPTEPIRQLHFEAPSHGPAHVHSLFSGAVYRGAQAPQDHVNMYAGPDRRLPSGGPDFGAKSLPISLSETVPAAAPETSHTESILQGGHAHLHSSSFGAQAPQDHVNMYAGPDWRLPSGGPGFGANSLSISLSETAPAAAPETSHTGNILQGGHAHNFNPVLSVASANMPAQAHGQLLHQVQVQAHGQLQPQVPAQSNSSAHPYYEDPGQVYQYYAQMLSSDNSTVYWTGVAHDPNQVYHYPRMQSSGNSASYWTGVAYQDPSQAYQDPRMLTYGQTSSYNHNVAVNDPPMQLQVNNPSYIAVTSHMPSSS